MSYGLAGITETKTVGHGQVVHPPPIMRPGSQMHQVLMVIAPGFSLGTCKTCNVHTPSLLPAVTIEIDLAEFELNISI